MNIKTEIQTLIHQVLDQMGLPKVSVEVDFTADEKFGDLSANTAMKLYSQMKKESDKKLEVFSSPRELAEGILSRIQNIEHRTPNLNASKTIEKVGQKSEKAAKTDDPKLTIADFIEKVEVAGPGFINFTLSEQFLLTQLDLVNEKKEVFGSKKQDFDSEASESEKSTRTLVEFTDPNPFKVFHMGHLFSNVIGESLSRLFESQGKQVRRVCYQGDVGMHVAKSLYGLLALQFDGTIPELEDANSWIKAEEKKTVEDRVSFLGKCYAHGATVYKEDEDSHPQIKKLNLLAYASAQKRLVEEEDWTPQVDYSQLTEIKTDELAVIDLLYRAGRAWSLEAFEKIYQRLGTQFEDYFFESEVGEYGVKLIKEHTGKVFEESQGAIVFKGESYGLHTRVFLNKLGLPVYEAKDLALVTVKANRWDYDESFVVTGNEINEYFKVVLKAMSLIKPEYAEKTNHIGHGMLRLPEGKMSSRTGNVLTGETILDEAQTRVMDIFDETDPDIPEAEREELADKIGLAAIKYALLKSDVSSDVAFSFKESVTFNGNSGPYIQYTFARCMSVLGKAKLSLEPKDENQGSGPEEENTLDASQNILSEIDWSTLDIELNLEERAVLNQIWKFSDAVARAADEYAPHYVATYVYELAQRFNSFYNKHSILNDSNGHDQTLLRLAITASTAQVLKNGLYLLGIESPEKM